MMKMMNEIQNMMMNERQRQQRKHRPLFKSFFINRSAYKKAKDGRRKRCREQGNDDISKPPTNNMKTVQYIFVERTAREKSEGVKEIAGKSTSTPTMKREAHNESVAKLVRPSTDNVAQTLSTDFPPQRKAQKQKVSGTVIRPSSPQKKAKTQKVAETISMPSSPHKKAQTQKVAATISIPSSPHKKKQKVSNVTTSSSQKVFAKKAVRYWNNKDELTLFNALLSYSDGGRGLPSNMAPVFNFVRPMLDTHFNNSQLSGKIRRARDKFHLIKASMEANSSSFEKNKYNFDNNQHQSALYDLWIQLWGEKTGNAAVDCKGKKKRDESENEDTHRITCEEDQQEEGREDQPKSKKTISQSIVKRKIGDAQISRELINQFRAERDTALKELKDAVQKMIKDNDSQGLYPKSTWVF